MHDIDTAFDDLRRDVATSIAGPAPGQIVRRVRRRTRMRIAAAGVAVAVAVGGGVAVRGAGTSDDQRVVTPPGPTAAPSVAPRKLQLRDLIYGPSVRKNGKAGNSGYWTSDGPGTELNVPWCKSSRETDLTLSDTLTGTAQRYELNYSGNPSPGNEYTSSEQGEQVIAFTDVAAARQIMNSIVTVTQTCRKDPRLTTLSRPHIGEEAVRISTFERGQGGSVPSQTQNAVAVRQGSVIAIYWSVRNEGPKLTTPDKHERDARTMAARLASLGYHS